MMDALDWTYFGRRGGVIDNVPDSYVAEAAACPCNDCWRRARCRSRCDDFIRYVIGDSFDAPVQTEMLPGAT
jgi:hypothetical protein